MIIICDNYIDGIFKTANFKFLNLNYIICYSNPRVTFSPPASKVQKNLCLHVELKFGRPSHAQYQCNQLSVVFDLIY